MNSKQPIRLDDLEAGHPLRQHPFEAANAGVPPGYFDGLASRVQARVAVANPAPAENPLISWSWGRTVATLASAGLVATLVWVSWPQRQNSIGRENLSGVSHTAILAYLDEQGVNPTDLNPTQQTNLTATGDSTTIQFLDLTPASIRQHLDTQDLTDELTNIGS